MTERYIFVHEYTRGQRISVTIEGEITLELLDALGGYVERHKAMIEQDAANKELIDLIGQSRNEYSENKN